MNRTITIQIGAPPQELYDAVDKIGSTLNARTSEIKRRVESGTPAYLFSEEVECLSEIAESMKTVVQTLGEVYIVK